MRPNLQQALLGGVVVAVALVVGVVAAGLINLSPLGSSSEPTGGATRPRATSATSAEASAGPTAGLADVAVLVGAGDIADCERFEDELTADLVESIPGIVFTLGDNAGDGSLDDYEDCYGPTWGRPSIKDRTRPAIGDNEYESLGARGYFAYFGEAAGPPDLGYYAYNAGAWRVYVLNSECSRVGGCGEGSAQATWLLQDLAAEPRECVLAIMHRPYFTSGPSGGQSSATRNLWRILQEARAEIVLSGHDHHYERFAPQTGDGTVLRRGLVQFVVGTGGDRPDDVLQAPNSQSIQTNVAGVLRLELSPEAYAFEFITVSGPEFSDSGTGECR